MRALRTGLILLCAAIFCSGCPVPTMDSIVGTWEAVGVATAPLEMVGAIDRFQLELYEDGTGVPVPGSGIDVGLDPGDLELEGWAVSYTFNGQHARIVMNISLRYQGMDVGVTHVSELDVVAFGEMSGTRRASVFSEGVFLVSVEWEESWTLISKSLDLGEEFEVRGIDESETLSGSLPQAIVGTLSLTDLARLGIATRLQPGASGR